MKEGTSIQSTDAEQKEETTKNTAVTKEGESKEVETKKDEETVSAPENPASEQAPHTTEESSAKKKVDPSTVPVTIPKETTHQQPVPKKKDTGSTPKAATTIKKEMKKIFGNPKEKKKSEKKIEVKKAELAR